MVQDALNHRAMIRLTIVLSVTVLDTQVKRGVKPSAEPFMSVVRTRGHVVLRLLVQVVTLLLAGGQHK